MAERKGYWELFSGKSVYITCFEHAEHAEYAEGAEEAMRFVYYEWIYPNYRGWEKTELPAVEWRRDRDGSLRGYINNKLAYTIAYAIENRSYPTTAYRGMGLHEWAAGNYQSFDDWLNVIEVKQDTL